MNQGLATPFHKDLLAMEHYHSTIVNQCGNSPILLKGAGHIYIREVDIFMSTAVMSLSKHTAAQFDDLLLTSVPSGAEQKELQMSLKRHRLSCKIGKKQISCQVEDHGISKTGFGDMVKKQTVRTYLLAETSIGKRSNIWDEKFCKLIICNQLYWKTHTLTLTLRTNWKKIECRN